MRITHKRREELKGDGSRGESRGEGRRNAGRLLGVKTRRAGVAEEQQQQVRSQ